MNCATMVNWRIIPSAEQPSVEEVVTANVSMKAMSWKKKMATQSIMKILVDSCVRWK